MEGEEKRSGANNNREETFLYDTFFGLVILKF